MKEQSNVTLLESLEQLTTPQLDDMLRVELEKELPEEHTVRLILKVLRAREADFPVVRNGQIDAALETYRRKVSPAADKPGKPLRKSAAIAAPTWPPCPGRSSKPCGKPARSIP